MESYGTRKYKEFAKINSAAKAIDTGESVAVKKVFFGLYGRIRLRI
jgi:hypothetical protein